MRYLDKVFLIFFARARREYGESQLRFAWERAMFTLATALVLPLLAVAYLATEIAMLTVDPESPAVFRRTLQFGAALAGALMVFRLRSRFGHYLISPPPLEAEELPSHASYARRFRLFSFVSFALAALVASLRGFLRN
jgi:hypothetical protein